MQDVLLVFLVLAQAAALRTKPRQEKQSASPVQVGFFLCARFITICWMTSFLFLRGLGYVAEYTPVFSVSWGCEALITACTNERTHESTACLSVGASYATKLVAYAHDQIDAHGHAPGSNGDCTRHAGERTRSMPNPSHGPPQTSMYNAGIKSDQCCDQIGPGHDSRLRRVSLALCLGLVKCDLRVLNVHVLSKMCSR